ncbi:MBL fold metallo-hydrolase [soil metagenome]
MKLTWYGHATFYIKAEDGTTIFTDPHNPATSGYAPYDKPADIVVMSSSTDDFHNNESLIPGEHIVVNALELAQSGRSRTKKGIAFEAVEALENTAHRGGHPDQNGMYRFEIDGVTVGHMGDMGNALSAPQLEFFRGVDVLLALAGGYPVIGLDSLKKMIDEVKPKLVVPMHFQTLRLKTNDALWLGDFLSRFDKGDIDFACDDTVTLTKTDLPEETRVLVLDHV